MSDLLRIRTCAIIPVLTLCLSAALAEPPLDPPSSPFLVDTSGPYVRADSGTRSPAVASNGTDYCVAWQDKRNGQWDIYAARVSPTGRVLDTCGFPVCTAGGAQQYPRMFSNGSGFLALWEDQRSGMRWNIHAARLDSNGHVLDSSSILLRAEGGDKHSPSAAWGEGKYLVAWDEYVGSRNIVAAFVDTGGQVSAGIEVCAESGTQGSPSVAYGDSLFLVAWDDTRNGNLSAVYAARVTASGTLLDTGGFPVMIPHDAQQLPSVAYDGTNFLIVWQEGPLLNSDILAARIAPSSAILDTAAFQVSGAARDQYRPRTVFTDSQYFVLWEDVRGGNATDVYCARVSPAGFVVDTGGIQVSAENVPKDRPDIAYGSDQLLAVWQDTLVDSLVPGIRGVRIAPTGTSLDSASLLIGYGLRKRYTQQGSPSLSFGDSSWLVVWSDLRPDTVRSDIYALRIGVGGERLDQAALRISYGLDDDRSPRAAFDGANWLVVWQDSGNYGCDIRGRRLSKTGVVLDSAALAITSTGNAKCSPDIVFDGSNFLVVWQEWRTDVHYVYGRRVSSEGIVLDTVQIPISVLNGSLLPTIAAGDSWSLVAWQDAPAASWDIHAVRVNRAGRVLDSLAAKLNSGIGRCRSPAIVHGGGEFLVVWIDRPGVRDVVSGTLVRWPGHDPETTQVAIYQGQPAPALPAVAFDGRYYQAMWRSSEFAMSIRGARINQFGTVMDLFPVLAGTQDYYLADLTSGPDSSMLLVFTSVTESINGYPAHRTRVWGLPSPFSGIDEHMTFQVPGYRPPTIVRGALFLSEFAGHRPQPTSWLLDATGRKVLTLHVGANDVRSLPAGIYFVRIAQAQAQAQAIRKIIVTR